jgi:hypothetical protein
MATRLDISASFPSHPLPAADPFTGDLNDVFLARSDVHHDRDASATMATRLDISASFPSHPLPAADPFTAFTGDLNDVFKSILARSDVHRDASAAHC